MPAPFIANGIEGSYELAASVGPDQTQLGDTLTISYLMRNIHDDPDAMVLVYPKFFNTQQPVRTTFPDYYYVNVQDGQNVNSVGARVFTAPSSGASGTFACMARRHSSPPWMVRATRTFHRSSRTTLSARIRPTSKCRAMA